MPHLRLDLSSGVAEGVDLAALLSDLSETLGACETVAPASIKAYANVRTVWVTGTGAPPEFVHLEIALLDGRPQALRAEIADRLAERLILPFRAGVMEGRVGLTLEVRTMDREIYRKCGGPTPHWHAP
ncbi:MAG TPA: hypothetical protein PLH94_09405 [Fimbriimonadaceae bacterium]|nr:hypothetical protein [Fimbriimonadaceae bacterium]